MNPLFYKIFIYLVFIKLYKKNKSIKLSNISKLNLKYK